MTDQDPTTDHRPLADRLIEAEGMPAMRSKGDLDPMFERLLEDERRFEVRLRRIAIGSWAVALFCLTLLVTVVAFAGDLRIGPRVRAGEMVAMLLGPIGIVAFVAALVTSFVWLFRSRTPTLLAISRRLESLERRLSVSD